VVPRKTAASCDPRKKANPKAIVLMGQERFTVMTPPSIRMEWAADRKFEDQLQARWS
jgi:hypothetical protein